MTAATVRSDPLPCCAAGTEFFGNELQSDFSDSCSLFFSSRKGSHFMFILLARSRSSWGDTGKVDGVPLTAQNLSLRILKVCMSENKTGVQREQFPYNSKLSIEISSSPPPLKKKKQTKPL